MGFHHHYVHGPKLVPKLLGGASAATVLLGSEADGLSIDFTDASLVVRDTTTSSNAYNGNVQAFWRDRSFTSYASPSPKITRGSDGLYGYRPHNLVTMSEAFAAATWSKSDTTVTTNTTAAPDGTTTADTVTVSAGAAAHYISQSITWTAAFYTVSCYAKLGTHRYWQITTWDGTTSRYGNFDLQTGAIGTASGGTNSITDVGGGWYRLVFVSSTAHAAAGGNFTITAVDSSSASANASWNAAGTETGIIWGAQVNAGPTATTYVKTAAHNLCLQSQTFDNGSWTKNNSAIAANSVAAPDGTTTADTLTLDDTGGAGTIANVTQGSIGRTANLTYTSSIYVKKNTARYVWISLQGTVEGHYAAVFDLDGGGSSATETDVGTTTGTVVSTAQTAVGNGWYRLSLTGHANTATASMDIGCAPAATGNTFDTVGRISWDNAGTESVYLWGAQHELASSPGKYVTTVAAAVYEARYELPREWDSSGVCQGLLVEEARTNLPTRSQEFGNAAWTKANFTITADQAAAPDGTTTADLFDEGAATGAHTVQAPVTVADGAVVAGSVFLKSSGSMRYVGVYVTDAVAKNYAVLVDLQSGTIANWTGFTAYAAPTSSSITAFANGWYRVAIVADIDGGVTTAGVGVSGSEDDGSLAANADYTGASKTFYAWGAQLEAGAFATSYIPTTSASVTRAVDNITAATSVFPYSATTATLFYYGTNTEKTGTAANAVSDGNVVIAEVSGETRVYNSATGGFLASLASITDGVAFKAAAGLDSGANASRGAINGALSSTFTNPETSGTLLHLGDANAGSGVVLSNKHVRQIMCLPRRMTNGQLQTVTT